MAFTLNPLPYDASALEPVIDTDTMRIHHDRHHQAYVDNLNKALEGDGAKQDQSLEQLLANASSQSPAVRNNGGGHWNHSFFWPLMAPPGQAGEPSGPLRERINQDFGSVEAMQEQFNSAGLGRFGSGWAWVVWAGGRLQITSTPNQDNPLMDVAETRGRPVIGNDVWEHAYYLKHQNKRGDYLKGWWQVLNWTQASRNFEEAQRG